MALWLVAMEAVIYEEVEAPGPAEAQAEAEARYAENEKVDIVHIIDIDIMTSRDDTTPHDRVRESLREEML